MRKSLGYCSGTLLIPLLLLQPQLLLGSEEEQIEQKQGELKALQSQISNLESSLKGEQNQQQRLQAELQKAEEQIGRQARKLRVLNTSLGRQKSKLNKLREQKAAEIQDINRNRAALAQQLRSAYMMGRQERVKILLNQQDPSVVSRMMVYYDYFNRARSEQISSLTLALQKLEETEQVLAQEEQRLNTLQEEARQEQAQMLQSQAARKQVIATLGADIQDKSKLLTGYKRSERRLQDLVKKLQIEITAVPLDDFNNKPFKSLRGKLNWPAKGRLKARFGTRRAGNLKWDGVMISAPEGDEVKAVHHGRVAFADWLRGFGLLIIIDHGDGYMSLYGHNQSLFKETGEWVQPGETVALTGNSGGQSSTGVYFGIRYNGRPVNPIKWCRRTQGNKVGALHDKLSGSGPA